MHNYSAYSSSRVSYTEKTFELYSRYSISSGYCHPTVCCSSTCHFLSMYETISSKMTYLIFTAVDCGPLGNPDNGQVTHTGKTTFRWKATYRCETGFYLVGDRTRVCQATGKWSESVPTCQRMLFPHMYT